MARAEAPGDGPVAVPVYAAVEAAVLATGIPVDGDDRGSMSVAAVGAGPAGLPARPERKLLNLVLGDQGLAGEDGEGSAVEDVGDANASPMRLKRPRTRSAKWELPMMALLAYPQSPSPAPRGSQYWPNGPESTAQFPQRFARHCGPMLPT